MYYIQLVVAFLEWSGNSRTLSQYLVNFTLCVTRHKMRQIAKGFFSTDEAVFIFYLLIWSMSITHMVRVYAM